jgi:hypothetical protein
VAVLLVIVTAGSIGYMLIEDYSLVESLYMTIITV